MGQTSFQSDVRMLIKMETKQLMENMVRGAIATHDCSILSPFVDKPIREHMNESDIL